MNSRKIPYFAFGSKRIAAGHLSAVIALKRSNLATVTTSTAGHGRARNDINDEYIECVTNAKKELADRARVLPRVAGAAAIHVQRSLQKLSAQFVGFVTTAHGLPSKGSR